MNASFEVEFRQLFDVARQRANGVPWAKIAEGYPVDENALVFRVETDPRWEGILAEARQRAFADIAAEAILALRDDLRGGEARPRSNAAAQLLRLHLTTVRHDPKPRKAEPSKELPVPAAAVFAESANGAEPTTKRVEEPGRAGKPASDFLPKLDFVLPEIPKKECDAPRPRPVNLRRDMLLAPLISSKRIERPPDRKRG